MSIPTTPINSPLYPVTALDIVNTLLPVTASTYGSLYMNLSVFSLAFLYQSLSLKDNLVSSVISLSIITAPCSAE